MTRNNLYIFSIFLVLLKVLLSNLYTVHNALGETHLSFHTYKPGRREIGAVGSLLSQKTLSRLTFLPTLQAEQFLTCAHVFN